MTYVEDKQKDVIAYSHAMKVLEGRYLETPLLVVAENEEEILKNLFQYFKEKYSMNSDYDSMRPDSFKITVVSCHDEEINGVKFSHGTGGTSTFTWDKLLSEYV